MLRRFLNKCAISAVQPIIAKRDILQRAKHPSAKFFHLLGKCARYVYYRTMQKREDYLLNIQGVWLKNRDDATFIYCLRGYYGFAYSQHLKSKKRPFTFIDIGANIGLYSLIALKNKNCTWVHAFDPDPETIPYLQANLDFTGQKNFSLHPYAVSDVAGVASLNTREGHSGNSTISDPTFDVTGTQSVTVVNYEYLNSIIPQDNSDVSIKIDVEGHDLQVLRSLDECEFLPRVTEIFAELNSNLSDSSQVLEWFAQHGFVESWRTGTDHWEDVLFVRIQNANQ